MTDPIHIMLDLETWGTEPGCDIRSIGACVFDPHNGIVADGTGILSTPFYVACDNPFGYRVDGEFHPRNYAEDTERQFNLVRDQRTVDWWNDPERAEAAKAFVNAIPLDQACAAFTGWLDGVRPYEETGGGREYAPVCLWSHGAHFDGPILAAVYAACGMPVPWHYRAPRDTRTAFDMAGIDDHTAHITKFASGTYHHALDDAVTQAKAVCAAYATVRGWYQQNRRDDQGFNIGGPR